MINNVVLTGRLTRNLDLKYSQSGTAMIKTNLAVNRRFKRDGEPDADFISIIVFGKSAEALENYASKGSLIGVEGRLQTGSYEKDDGTKVYTTDVVVNNFTFLESKGSNQKGNDNGGFNSTPAQNPFGGGKEVAIDNDDLPF